MYLLDTDTLIFMVRGLKPGSRPSPHKKAQKIADRCRQVQAAGEVLALSAITVSELEFGARGSADYPGEMAAVAKVIAPFKLFDYDSDSCPVHYGRIREDLERAGVPIGAMDLLIAAHACALD